MFSVASLWPTSAVSRLFSPIHQNQNDFCRSQGRCRKVCWLDFELSCYSRSLMFWKIWNYIVEKDFRFRLFFTESEFGWNNFGEKLPLENFRWVNQNNCKKVSVVDSSAAWIVVQNNRPSSCFWVVCELSMLQCWKTTKQKQSKKAQKTKHKQPKNAHL